MTSPADRVREMVREGRVAPEEGERLLAALGQAPKPSAVALFTAPFDRLATAPAIGVGLGIAAIELALFWLGARYDGFLDAHVFNGPRPPVSVALFDQVLAWPVAAAVFWAVACIFDRRARLVDFIAVIGVARAPYAILLLPIAYLAPSFGEPTSIASTAAEAAMIAVAISFIAWLSALLYAGFKHASGLRGARAVVGLVIAVGLAEAVTKVLHATLSKFVGG